MTSSQTGHHVHSSSNNRASLSRHFCLFACFLCGLASTANLLSVSKLRLTTVVRDEPQHPANTTRLGNNQLGSNQLESRSSNPLIESVSDSTTSPTRVSPNENHELEDTNDLEKMVESRRHQRLPSLKQGGIVLFFHVPKTAGSSIRNQAKNLFEFTSTQGGKNEQLFDVVEQQILNWTSVSYYQEHSRSIVKFVEFHGRHPTFVQLRDKLALWRQRAEAIHMPFFVFATLRDPVNTQISIFNFFCIKLQYHVRCKVPLNEKGLMLKSVSDPQSRWLCHTSITLQDGNFSSSTMHHDVLQHMDWVGTTEKLNETIHVLNNVLPTKFKLDRVNKNTMKKRGVVRSELSPDKLRGLESNLTMDNALYDMVKSAYSINILDSAY